MLQDNLPGVAIFLGDTMSALIPESSRKLGALLLGYYFLQLEEIAFLKSIWAEIDATQVCEKNSSRLSRVAVLIKRCGLFKVAGQRTASS